MFIGYSSKASESPAAVRRVMVCPRCRDEIVSQRWRNYLYCSRDCFGPLVRYLESEGLQGKVAARFVLMSPESSDMCAEALRQS